MTDDPNAMPTMPEPFLVSPIGAFLPLTRLNENDNVIVMRDAIDCIQPLDTGLPGCVIFLRGGHMVRAQETVDQIVEALQ